MNWIPGGPAAPGYDGPSMQCDKHVIVTKHDGTFLCWTLFDRNPDGTLTQRFGGSSMGGADLETMNRILSVASDMLTRSPRHG
ncbi:hypothetical protein AYO47_00185 [Planctomyces sp. SCGC AG-212-M04]|nr:hypothetical protein AYO47_00185 [Planctomyces sp. SCGC AG-212-M04]